jgi:hypothetical protein
MTPKATPEGLSTFVQAHRVTAEIFPHYEVHDHRCIQTGFELTLLALPSTRCSGDPGCPECERVHALLREIALAVLPGGWHHATEPFEAAFHYRRQTRWRPEIELVVQMLPYDQTRGTVDEAARHEMEGVRKRLHDIGVGEEAHPPLGRAA